MEEKTVSYKTSLLAKEKGFNEETYVRYSINTKEKFHGNLWLANNSLWAVASPTHGFLQKWIREKHHIHIEISYDWITYDVLVDHPDIEPIKLISSLSDDDEYAFTEYEDAMERGLVEGLKLIDKL